MSIRIDNNESVIDVRDIIVRFEEIEADDEQDEDDEQEAAELAVLLGDLAGNGGDEQWRGDWYPVTLIRDSHFTEYAEQLAEEIGAINSDASWPLGYIDWEAAADALKIDYTTVDYDGVTYWYR